MIQTFVIRGDMTIVTKICRENTYDRYLRRSILYLLGWFQRTALISEKSNLIKNNVVQMKMNDYQLHNFLLRYYCRNRRKHLPQKDLIEIKTEYTLDDIGDEIYINKYAQKYLLLVKVQHSSDEKHTDLIPLIALKDLN